MHIEPGPMVVLDVGDLVAPVDRRGRRVGEVRPLMADGRSVLAEWRLDELDVEPDCPGGLDVTLGFVAYLGDDPADPGVVAFTGRAAGPLRIGTRDTFTVIDQAG